MKYVVDIHGEIEGDYDIIGKVTKDKTVLNILEEVKKYDT